MAGEVQALDEAEARIEALTRQWTADALGEAGFLQTIGHSRQLSLFLTAAAMERAALRVKAQMDSMD